MKASRAYITSLGTTGLLLSFALLLLVVMSAIVAFRAWPGDAGGGDSATVRIDSGRPARDLARERRVAASASVRTARPAAAARPARRATATRDRGSVMGVSESGASGSATPPAAAPVAEPPPAAAPVADAPAVAPPVAEPPVVAPSAPRVDQVSSGLADTTPQVTEDAGGALDLAPAAPVQHTVEETGEAVSNTVQQTVDTAEGTLPELP